VNLVDELHGIAAALAKANVAHAVCGGVAVTMHGATRSTKDIDILVKPDDLAQALDAVRPLGYVFSALPMVFEEGTTRERHVQRVSKIVGDEHIALDLILTMASLSGFLDDRIEVALPEGHLWVVSRDALLRMKRLAGRPQDLADIEKLEQGDES
jgi:hypothetical protein